MARTAYDHSKVVLSAILGTDRKDLLDFAVLHLEPDHFPDPTHRNFFVLLRRVVQISGGVMTKETLSDAISKTTQDRGKLSLYEEMYELFSEAVVDDSDFKWSIEQLKELSAERATSEAIARGMEILTRGSRSDKGEDLFGHEDARSYILGHFSDIDKTLNKQAMPGGDTRTEVKEILREYIDHRDNPEKFSGIPYGVPVIDSLIGGAGAGELILIAAYANCGKTQMSIQAAWNAFVGHGKNVIYFTSETLRPQIRRRLISRHSRLPQFELPTGLDSNDIKFGRLTKTEESILSDVVYDYGHNSNYGKMVVEQFPQGASLSYVENTLYRYNRDFQVDYVIVDSIPWLKPDSKKISLREELVDLVQSAKTLATSFDNGRGIPFVSPWQVNRSSYEEARKVGYYSTTSLSETAEATNASDIIITLLKMDEHDDSRYSEIIGQIAKNRDGVRGSGLNITIDYATSYFSSSGGARGSDSISSLIGEDSIFEGIA